MSFFAVLDPEDFDQRSGFEVSRLHLNLWSLAALGIHRRMFVFDVGMNITAGPEKVTKISLALPFDTLEPRSLFDKVLDRRTAELIFDNRITSIGEESLEYAGVTLHPIEAVTQSAKKVDAYSSRGFSLWDIQLMKPIQPEQSGYVRVRFPVVGTGRTWQWTRSRFMRTGAIFDFRISDIRGSAKVEGGSQLIDRIRPVTSVAAFVMAPIWLHGRTLHPEARYIRLLEGNVWANYLDRSPELSRRSRLVVYYWKHADPQKPVTIQHPMRAFAEFKIDARRSGLPAAVFGSFVTALIFWALFGLQARPDIARFVSEAWTNTIAALPWLFGITAGLGVVVLVLELAGFARKVVQFIRERFHAFEVWLFHFLRDVGPRD